MERYQLSGGYASLRHLVHTTPEGEVSDTLRDLVETMVRAGRSREDVYEDLKRLVMDLRHEERDELEDAVMNVMDLLTGWCSPSARV
jgi:hypothetical protein